MGCSGADARSIHTTAHCIAALELFDAKPLHKLKDLRFYTDPEERCEASSPDLEWRGNPWRESHRGAGLFAAMVIAEEVDSRGRMHISVGSGKTPIQRLGCWQEQTSRGSPIAEQRPWCRTWRARSITSSTCNGPDDRAVIRSAHRRCLAMYEERQFPLGQRIGFAEIDWFYCMNRSLRQCNHRFEESRAAIAQLGRELADYVSVSILRQTMA